MTLFVSHLLIITLHDYCCNQGFIVINTILAIITNHSAMAAVTMQYYIVEIAKQVNITVIVAIAASLGAIESRHMAEINQRISFIITVANVVKDIAAIISMHLIIEIGCYLVKGIPAVIAIVAMRHCCCKPNSSNCLGFLVTVARLMELIQLLCAYEVICQP